MNTNKKTARIMVDVKIILSALWAARMLSGLQGDVVRFMGPGKLEEYIEGTTGMTITNELLLVMSIVFFVPILMVFLSLLLKPKVNRWANIVLGIFFTVFLPITMLMTTYAYYIFLGIVEIVFTALIVWYAWKWPKQEA